MKKLKKLQINHSRLMTNEELLTLKGGQNDGGCCNTYCSSDSQCTCKDCPKCQWGNGAADYLCLNP